jgi:hypothetical protein
MKILTKKTNHLVFKVFFLVKPLKIKETIIYPLSSIIYFLFLKHVNDT